MCRFSFSLDPFEILSFIISNIFFIYFVFNSLYDIGRRLSQSNRSALNLVATNLRRLKSLPLAAEIYRKLGEEEQVVQLHIESRDWNEAFRLAEICPQMYWNLCIVNMRNG